jgi:hypothetical protein
MVMQTPLRAGAWPGSLTAFVLSTALLACGGASKDGAEGKAETPAKTEDAPAQGDEAKADEAKADEAKADDAKADDAKADDGAVVAAADPSGEPAAASGAPPTPAEPDEAGGGEAAGEAAGVVDAETLLKEIKNKKTKDARAQQAAAEAEAAGADPAALAKALVARGQTLFAQPDRAKPFFELANDKDPKSPAAAFELAKQAALVGEIDEAKTWLEVVHQRKGKKLLKQIDFDPMWEIVKDDPDVRAMLK